MRIRSLAAGCLAALALTSQAYAQVRLNDPASAYSLGVVSWRDLPFRSIVRQHYDFSCGSAAVATVLRYNYGRDVSEGDVFREMFAHGDQAKIRGSGFSMLDMKAYLEPRGFKADGYRVSFEQLQQLRKPAIVLIQVRGYRHFVVIKGVRPDAVLIGDPVMGLKLFRARDFKKVWNGLVFVVDGPPGVTLTYDVPEEWRPWSTAPVGMAVDGGSLSAFTRELPPIYQITTTFSLDPIFQ
jgi:predicted double-glycine peptidase